MAKDIVLVDKENNQYLVESTGRDYGIVAEKGVRRRIPINYLLEECQSLVESVEEKEEIEAYNMGQRAFKKGIKRVPAKDRDFMLFIENRNGVFGESAILSKKWLEGWDKVNLSEALKSYTPELGEKKA